MKCLVNCVRKVGLVSFMNLVDMIRLGLCLVICLVSVVFYVVWLVKFCMCIMNVGIFVCLVCDRFLMLDWLVFMVIICVLYVGLE